MAQSMTLPDGRNFDFLVSGPADGFPLIFIHGTPGSYRESAGFPAACEKKGMRCISMGRAGYDGSSRHLGRRIVDCVADIEALKDHLGIKECVVAGWSGGSSHALACGARLPGCRGVLFVAGLAPYDLFTAEGLDFLEGQGQDNIDEFNATFKGEAALQEFLKPARNEMLKTDAAGMMQMMASLLPDCDLKAMETNPSMGQNLVDSIQSGLKNSADGWADDDLSFVQPWGFDLAEIKIPIFLWQGSKDLMVPMAHGQWLAKHLPQEKLVKHLVEGEGHISIFDGRIDDMVDELLSTAR